MKPARDPRPSGDRRMARLLMEALDHAGMTVETASCFASFDGDGDGVRQSRLAALGARIAASLVRRYSRRRRRERPDLWFTYHLYHKAPDWLGPTVSRALDIPYVVAEASHAPKQARGPWAIGYNAAASAIAQADLVFNLNRADAAGVLPLLADPARLVALAPFIDRRDDAGRAGGRQRARAAIAGRHGFDDASMPLLLCVAMMRPGDKLASYRCLASALGHLRAHPWRLLVAGDGPARAAVDRALAPLGRRVLHCGTSEGAALADAYAAADLFVWPAIGEAYGMALLEAQRAGLPVIAGRTGGVPGVVADGSSGLLVAPGRPQAMAVAIDDLLTNARRRQAMARAATARVRRHHNLSAAAARLRIHLAPLLDLSRS